MLVAGPQRRAVHGPRVAAHMHHQLQGKLAPRSSAARTDAASATRPAPMSALSGVTACECGHSARQSDDLLRVRGDKRAEAQPVRDPHERVRQWS